MSPRESATRPLPPLDVQAVRADFPILARKVHGRPLVYLDSAATTQKPKVVLDSVADFYRTDYSNVHRGVHYLSERSTDAYERARAKVARFIHAAEAREIVFVRGTTEGINLVARTLGDLRLRRGDEVLLTHMEHHSNIVPWQLACERTGARIKVLPVTDRGELELAALDDLLSDRTRIVAVAHVSNALGTINPIAEISAKAHAAGAVVVVDGAQAVPRIPVDVQSLGCDFYAFSGHKCYGPSGIGALWGRAELLDGLPPYEGGGEMIRSVSFEGTSYNEIPYRFEAGTPNISGAVGLRVALDYLDALGIERVAAHEDQVLAYGTEVLEGLDGVQLIGTAPDKTAVLSFLIDGVHPHDGGTILDREGIAVRAGHHCAQPLMERFGVPATLRASLGVYNTVEEIDALAAGIRKVQEIFAG